MKRCKYLDDLWIEPINYGGNFVKERKLRRFHERLMYGFDYREIINPDLSFAEWLYTRTMMLKEQTLDDLTFHKVYFEEKTYNMEEALSFIIENTKEYLLYYEKEEMEGNFRTDKELEELHDKMRRVTRLWAEIMFLVSR